MNQFSQKVSEILSFSKEEAERLASGHIGPEHILLGIMREKNGIVKEMFNDLHINIDTVKYNLEERIRLQSSEEAFLTADMSLSDKANNILRLAVLEARIQRTTVVDIHHVLLAILHDKADNGAREVLESNNLDYNSAAEFFRQKANTPRNGIGMPEDDEEDDEQMY